MTKTADDRARSRLLQLLVLAAAACISISGCAFVGQPSVPESNAPTDLRRPASTPAIAQLPFGNPSNATNDPANEDNFLIVRDSSVISYNNRRGTANWIAWRTTRRDLGGSIARPLFEPDPDLPDDFRRIGYYDYSGSGYDRGHLVPAADRFGNPDQFRQTFFMTNIVPQTGDLNQFPWEKFESYARSLVYRGNELYTISGVYGDAGRLRNKITVPTNCWKVIVVFGRGQRVDTITNVTRIIAVDMPNADGIEDVPWERYKTTVRAIEERTGFNLFRSLPRDIQDRIETRANGN